jgi:hypothetical protein
VPRERIEFAAAERAAAESGEALRRGRPVARRGRTDDHRRLRRRHRDRHRHICRGERFRGTVMRYGSLRFGRPRRAEPLLPNPVPLPALRRVVVPAPRLTDARRPRDRGTRAVAVPVAPVARRADADLRAARHADVEPKRDGRPVAARGWTRADRAATLAAGRRSIRPVATRRGLPMAVGGPHLSPETERPPYPPATAGTRATSRGDLREREGGEGDHIAGTTRKDVADDRHRPRSAGARARRRCRSSY